MLLGIIAAILSIINSGLSIFQGLKKGSKGKDQKIPSDASVSVEPKQAQTQAVPKPRGENTQEEEPTATELFFGALILHTICLLVPLIFAMVYDKWWLFTLAAFGNIYGWAIWMGNYQSGASFFIPAVLSIFLVLVIDDEFNAPETIKSFYIATFVIGFLGFVIIGAGSEEDSSNS